MVKKTYKTLRKDYLQRKIKLLERKVVVAKEYMGVVEKRLTDKNNRLIENMERKNRRQLLPLEKSAVSQKEYHQSLIDKEMTKYDEKLKWKKIAVNHKANKLALKDERNRVNFLNESKSEINSLDNKREVYLNNLINKYPLIDLDSNVMKQNKTNYENLKLELDKNVVNLTESLNKKSEIKLSKFKNKNERELIKLHKKLDVEYEKINKIFNEEKEALISRKKELEELLTNKNDDQYEAYLKELDEIEALFEMYDDENILLRVKNLNMNFGGLKAVDNLTFDIKKGEIYGLIGPNGAGKTTVFNCITQFYKPSSGKIYLNNHEQVVDLMDVKVHDVIRHGIVRTFQNVELVWELSVLDNLLVASHSLYESGFFTQLLHLPKLKKEEDVLKAKALRALEYLDLLEYKDAYPVGLPYGILKRIELARTFMTDPKLIILDEPAAGLNEKETLDLAETIKRISVDFGTTIFLVEHDMGLVMDVCDRICAINFGKKITIGTPVEIQNHPQVQEAYLGGE